MDYYDYAKQFVDKDERCIKFKEVIKNNIQNIISSANNTEEIKQQLPFINDLWADLIIFFAYDYLKDTEFAFDFQPQASNILNDLFKDYGILIYDNVEDFMLAIKCYYSILTELNIIEVLKSNNKSKIIDNFLNYEK